MSDNLKRIIYLEDDLKEYLLNGIDTTNLECEKIVLKIAKLLDKIDNQELVYLLENGTAIHDVIDVTYYFKKYKIDKKKLKENNEYLDVFKKLSLFIQSVSLACVNDQEYTFVCSKCDVDNVSNYLLKNMSNEDIMQIANEATDWSYKLFLFEYLKV